MIRDRETLEKAKRDNPFDSASIISRTTFWWESLLLNFDYHAQILSKSRHLEVLN
jgi:hypothetical protein